MKGVVYVALGANALREAEASAETLRKHNRTLTIKILKRYPYEAPSGLNTEQLAHWAKVTAATWTPFGETLMIDADTRVKGDLMLGFKMLREGWELVLVPSVPPEYNSVLWSLSGEDREYTFKTLGTYPHCMFNSGVMYFRRSERIKALFKEWASEWVRFKDRDQGALVRALYRRPVSMFLLGPAFNSQNGEVVEHNFGRAR